MPNDQLIIKGSINEKIAIIDKDISDIEEIIQDIYDALLTLDEKKWNTKEKKKVDDMFISYMKIMTEKYPNYLRERLDLLRTAAATYNQVDLDIKQQATELDDLI